MPECIKLKNVGLMFFSPEPEKFFPYAQIDVVQFSDGLGGEQIIVQTFKGPLHQQLRSALLYIRNRVLTERVQKLPDVAVQNAKRVPLHPGQRGTGFYCREIKDHRSHADRALTELCRQMERIAKAALDTISAIAKGLEALCQKLLMRQSRLIIT